MQRRQEAVLVLVFPSSKLRTFNSLLHRGGFGGALYPVPAGIILGSKLFSSAGKQWSVIVAIISLKKPDRSLRGYC